MITFKELEEQLDEAHKVGDKVLIHKGPADVKGKEGHVSEIRKGLYKGAPKTYTVDYDHHETTGARKSIQLKPTHFKAIKEEADDATKKREKAMADYDKELRASYWKKHAELKKKSKPVKEEALDEVRMTAAMKLQQAFQREQEKTARERKAGEDLLKKKDEPKKTNEETVEEGLKPQHNMRPGWMLKADPELAAKVKKNKDIAKARRDSYGNPAAGKSVKEDAACNNVGGGAIAGTQGDAGKKSVAIKMMKRKELKNFKEFTESCDCWTGYKRVPGTKPCEKGSCKKA